MKQDIKKFDENIYQIDVFMEDKPGRMSCYYIDSSNPILIEAIVYVARLFKKNIRKYF